MIDSIHIRNVEDKDTTMTQSIEYSPEGLRPSTIGLNKLEKSCFSILMLFLMLSNPLLANAKPAGAVEKHFIDHPPEGHKNCGGIPSLSRITSKACSKSTEEESCYQTTRNKWMQQAEETGNCIASNFKHKKSFFAWMDVRDIDSGVQYGLIYDQNNEKLTLLHSDDFLCGKSCRAILLNCAEPSLRAINRTDLPGTIEISCIRPWGKRFKEILSPDY